MNLEKTARWRNLFAAIVFAVAWICLYLFPQSVGSFSLTPALRLAVLPLLIGIGVASSLAGSWSEKLPYILGVAALPMLLLGLYFSIGADPEGRAFAWMLVGMPLFPYLAGAGITTVIIELRQRGSPRKQ